MIILEGQLKFRPWVNMDPPDDYPNGDNDPRDNLKHRGLKPNAPPEAVAAFNAHIAAYEDAFGEDYWDKP
ncbi:MAG: hypothetical protein FWG64_04855 [Firmicutes bacterium]|nr:hypothetical protein [Bacillota bacterium]